MVDIVHYLASNKLNFLMLPHACIYMGKLYTKMVAVNLHHTSLVP